MLKSKGGMGVNTIPENELWSNAEKMKMRIFSSFNIYDLYEVGGRSSYKNAFISQLRKL